MSVESSPEHETSASSATATVEPPVAGPEPMEPVAQPTQQPSEQPEQTSEQPAEAGEPLVKAAPPRDETERIDPQPIELRLESGTEFDLEPLKLRQFLRLLRIVTRGAADVLDQAELDFEDPQSFVQTFLGMVLFSIPEAEDESIDFIKSMVKPKDLTGSPEKDLLKIQSLSDELDNPELEDTLTIIQAVIEREAEDLRALGKRLGAMFAVAQKMGATNSNAPTPQV